MHGLVHLLERGRQTERVSRLPQSDCRLRRTARVNAVSESVGNQRQRTVGVVVRLPGIAADRLAAFGDRDGSNRQGA